MVAVLFHATISSPSIITASVFVPPTSIPILLVTAAALQHIDFHAPSRGWPGQKRPRMVFDLARAPNERGTRKSDASTKISSIPSGHRKCEQPGQRIVLIERSRWRTKADDP